MKNIARNLWKMDEDRPHIHMEWDWRKEHYVVFDEDDRPIGWYPTKEDAEIAFEEYCNKIFNQDLEVKSRRQSKWMK